MPYSFGQLAERLRAYCSTTDEIFSLSNASAEPVRAHFLALAIATTSVYLEYLRVSAALPELYKAAKDGIDLESNGSVTREMKHRAQYGQAQDALPWVAFSAPPLAIKELRTAQDYRNNLYLHIPEIYEEGLCVQELIKGFMPSPPSPRTLTELEVGMSHLGNNHAAFVIPVLQGLARQENWAGLD